MSGSCLRVPTQTQTQTQTQVCRWVQEPLTPPTPPTTAPVLMHQLFKASPTATLSCFLPKQHLLQSSEEEANRPAAHEEPMCSG